MKNIIISFLFGCMAILISGCSADMPENLDSKSKKASSILQLHLNKADVTRGMNTSTSFQEGDEVLVYLWTSEYDSNGQIRESCKATYTNGKWILDKQFDLSKPYIQGDQECEWPKMFSIFVAYPYDKVQISPTLGSIFISDDLLSQNDILIGSKLISKDDPIVEITCEHAMTCLTFNVKNNSNNTVTIDGMSVKQKEIKLINDRQHTFLTSKALFNVDNIIMAYDQYMNCVDSCYCNYYIKIEPGETGNVDFLLYPTERLYKYMNDWDAEVWEKLQFELSVNGNPVHFDLDPAPWEAGKQYTYPVTLFYERKPLPDTDEYVDLGLSVLWAKYDVGSETPNKIGKYFFWGDTKGYEIGESYTQSTCSYINNKTAEELLNEKIVVENPNNVVARYKYYLTPEYDAATQNMGIPWRMPTAEEISEFKDNTKMDWYMEDGQWLFKFSSTVPGYEDRYIIMPGQLGCFYGYPTEIKYLDSFRNLSNIAGVWWGSTLNNDKERAYGFDVSWGEGDPVKYDNPTYSLYSTFRTWGHPVRAVRPLRVQ